MLRQSSLFAALAVSASMMLVPAGTASAAGLSALSAKAKPTVEKSALIEVRRRHHGRNAALGVAAIVGTAILLNEAARADGRRRYRRGSSCWELLDRCEAGSERACYRYEDRCTDY
jgi:hypothetical protein